MTRSSLLRARYAPHVVGVVLAAALFILAYRSAVMLERASAQPPPICWPDRNRPVGDCTFAESVEFRNDGCVMLRGARRSSSPRREARRSSPTLAGWCSDSVEPRQVPGLVRAAA